MFISSNGSPVDYDIFYLSTKTEKNVWNRNSNGKNVERIFGHPWKM